MRGNIRQGLLHGHRQRGKCFDILVVGGALPGLFLQVFHGPVSICLHVSTHIILRKSYAGKRGARPCASAMLGATCRGTRLRGNGYANMVEILHIGAGVEVLNVT